jgi:hypothetical protein
MIFGHTELAKWYAEQAEIKSMLEGRQRFRIYAKLHDGRRVFFKTVWEFYNGGRRANGDLFLWSISPEDYIPYRRCYLEYSETYIQID